MEYMIKNKFKKRTKIIMRLLFDKKTSYIVIICANENMLTPIE